ncbi:GntR family transcriptional regulator [Chitinophagaceae bacterium LB-8]|uniref:GntR family transcriptional regulator n=1 Tax=Paraflavisolibacter caeni TaxID=2982496 RepID=A0A9X2XZP0_9BACT|nr:winged helix-turn-helix domain-containing protein [Paraflavisolibacter caeni]MCU7551890.1 GntR family transcriptional regulator [Paraflavisolibacter caeni]
MTSHPFYKLIHIDEYSAMPKYQQLVNSIIKAIATEKLNIDDPLPSINELSFEFEISRDSVEKAYKHLKKTGIIGSFPGKGYYVKNTNVDKIIKIFLLFNKLSAHKKIIYESLANKLGDAATIDMYVYNNNFTLFKKLLLNCKEDYDYYIIMPHFLEGSENAHKFINTIPKDKLILLDKIIPRVTGNFRAVYENFEKDIYRSLEQALPRLSKYHALNIIFPEYTYYPSEIITGFTAFCQEYAFNYNIISDIKKVPLARGEVYINLLEDDLVTLIEKSLEENLVIGEDIGIISYNETSIKKVLLNGITTISTDFQMLGEKTAELILSQAIKQVEVNFYLNLRNSL